MVPRGLHSNNLGSLADGGSSLSGEFNQTLVLKSHVLSLDHVFIPKPFTKVLFGLLQVQSQLLELESGPSPV